MSTAEIIAELLHLSYADLAKVQAKLKELVESTPAAPAQPIARHPALGIWRDRRDLPDDSVEASNLLRQRMMRRSESADS